MRENHSTVLPTTDKLNINDLQSFLRAIEYSNQVMNLDGGDLNEANGLAVISDLSIVSDRTITPSIFFMVQYYGIEKELGGGIRAIKPQLIFMYNFNIKCWNIIDGRSSSFQSNHVDKMLNAQVKHARRKRPYTEKYDNLHDPVLRS